MIILTTPISVPNRLGSSSVTTYDKLRIVSINCDPVSMTIAAQVQLLVSSNLSQPILNGSLNITAGGASPVCTIQVPAVDFAAGVALTGPQVTTIQGWITALQNNIEAGLITISLVLGTQSTGT
jgi:hypothetical protein